MTAVSDPANEEDVEELTGSADGGELNTADGDASPSDADAPDSEPVLRPPTEDDLAHLVDLAFATATAWTRLPDRFYTLARGTGIDPDSAPTQPVLRALGFFLTEETKAGRRLVELRWKTGFHTEALPPPRLRSVADAEAEAWERLAGKVTHPAARARLLDMLVLRGGTGTPDRAAAAVAAYLDHAMAPSTVIRRSGDDDVEARWLDRGLTLSLGRALSLTRIAAAAATGPAITKRAVAVALNFAGARVRSKRPQVGSALSTLALLAANRGLLDPAETAQLLSLIEEEAAHHADLDHVVDQLMDLLILVDPSRREAAHRLRVKTRLDLAVGREPMVAMGFLEEAARLARTFHLDDLRDEAVREMQRVARFDHGLRSISTQITIPGPIIDAEVRRASDGADWRESMSNWLATPAPSGDLASNERTSRHIASLSVVRRLASVVLIGADNMPRWRPETEEDRDAYELSRTEMMRMTLSGELLSAALDRIVGLHGVPPVTELAMFLAGNGTGNVALATALARSFHRYWSGDYEGSLHTASVRVEAGARALVLLLDEPAYTVARTNAQGKYVGLDQLLDILARRDFDPDWDRFIRTLLLGPTGQNLRHDVAHGFILNEPSPSTAALALRACSLFVHLLWQPSTLLDIRSDPTMPRPAWTIMDAVRSTIGTAVRSPRLVPALLRSEAAAVRAALQRGRR
ncbi:DUF4209 domain-containing protein [Micromonospora palythoicola]|uniref:hypothetical protein n=1 Tax=Micromonospora palythoicola TaxID=3120507 RepID=UPI002FCDF05F